MGRFVEGNGVGISFLFPLVIHAACPAPHSGEQSHGVEVAT